jgi:uncharacterized protein YcbK (DUF882 family)
MSPRADIPNARRRAFVRHAGRLVPGAVALVLCGRLPAAAKGRDLTFRHTHTGESLTLRRSPEGAFDAAGIDRVDHFLRDFRTGDVHPIDRGVLEFLHEVHRATGSRGVFEVISGYRSPQTNAMLRGQSRAVASKSLHLQGRAIDVRLTDVASEDVRDVAISLERGGVGYYRRSDFVHLDTGRFRTW